MFKILFLFVITGCAIDYAHPLQYCSMCSENYLDVKHSFESMKSSNASCDNEIISADQIGFVGKVWDFIEDIWISSACDKCFIEKNNTYVLRNETIKYLTDYNITIKLVCYCVHFR